MCYRSLPSLLLDQSFLLLVFFFFLSISLIPISFLSNEFCFSVFLSPSQFRFLFLLFFRKVSFPHIIFSTFPLTLLFHPFNFLLFLIFFFPSSFLSSISSLISLPFSANLNLHSFISKFSALSRPSSHLRTSIPLNNFHIITLHSSLSSCPPFFDFQYSPSSISVFLNALPRFFSSCLTLLNHLFHSRLPS